MPLYIDPEKIEGIYPEEIIQVFRQIKEEVGNTAITPRIALNLIKKYFVPLDPDWINEALEIRKEVNWDTIYFVGVYLIQQGYAREGKDNPIASAIFDFYSYCKKTKKPQRLEPNHVFANCKLCWRHPIAYKNYCLLHSPSENNSRYRHALRGYEQFSIVNNELVQNEIEESQRTDSTYKYFFPKNNQKDWLKNVRPNLWSTLSENTKSSDERYFLQKLLLEIDWIEEESPAQKETRKSIHNEILQEPHLVSSMLQYAEAWIIVEKQRAGMRGGKRSNAGRKK